MNQNMKSIIEAYAFITKNNDWADIIEKLSKSDVFNQVANNNSYYLYESYSANLLEIIEELKQQDNCPIEALRINAKSVVEYNKSRRETKEMKVIIPTLEGEWTMAKNNQQKQADMIDAKDIHYSIGDASRRAFNALSESVTYDNAKKQGQKNVLVWSGENDG